MILNIPGIHSSIVQLWYVPSFAVQPQIIVSAPCATWIWYENWQLFKYTSMLGINSCNNLTSQKLYTFCHLMYLQDLGDCFQNSNPMQKLYSPFFHQFVPFMSYQEPYDQRKLFALFRRICKNSCRLYKSAIQVLHNETWWGLPLMSLWRH